MADCSKTSPTAVKSSLKCLDIQALLLKSAAKVFESPAKEQAKSQLKSTKRKMRQSLAEIGFGGHTHRHVKLHAIYAKIFVGMKYSDIGRAYGKDKSRIWKWVQDY